MKVFLFLSLALVVLASVSFAAPSRVILPAYAPEDINTRGKEIYEGFLEWRRSLPADGDRSFLAYQHVIKQRELTAEQEVGPETPLAENQQRESFIEELESSPIPYEPVEEEPNIEPNAYRAVEVPVDDGDQPQVVPLVSAFGFSRVELQRLYELWLPKVPSGQDSSFQAFLDWMREEEESNEREDQGGDSNDKTDEGGDSNDRTDQEDESKDKKEYVAEEQPIAEVRQSVDEEQTEINPPQVATDFGLAEAELEELYRIWLSKSRAGEDSSFQAFVNWMNEHNEPEVDEAGNPRQATYVRWGWKIADWDRNREKEESDVADEEQLAEVQRSADEEQPEINQLEVAADMERRESEEQEGLAPVPVEMAGPQEVLARVPFVDAESQERLAPFAFVDARSQDELTPVPVEEAEPQEEQTPVPFVETDPNDTNGGYSCEENSPCNIENIANEQFYFATATLEKYIQCDAWGGCHTLTCDDGLVWDDQIKTCGTRT